MRLWPAMRSAVIALKMPVSDVAFGFESVELDEIAGELHDPYGIAHIQDERVTRRRHDGGLQDELNRLRDRHEVAHRIRMGHGEGAAMLELAAK